jgi:PAS domain S-box-containing protein
MDRPRADALAALVSGSSDIILTVDAAGIIVYCSRAVERSLGFSAEELTGTSLLDLLSPDGTALGSVIRLLIGGADLGPQLMRGQGVNGGWRRFDVVGSRLPDGSTLGSVTFSARDVTDRHGAGWAPGAPDLHIETIVDTAREGVWQLDARGCVTYLSKRMAEILGAPAEEVVGRRIYDFIDATERPAMQDHLDVRRQGEGETYEQTPPVPRWQGDCRPHRRQPPLRAARPLHRVRCPGDRRHET